MTAHLNQQATGYGIGTALVRRLIALLAGVLFCGHLSLNAAEVAVARSGEERVPLAPHLSILRDPCGTMTLEGARAAFAAGRFTQNRQEWPSFGFTQDAIWARVELDFAAPQTDDWFVLTKSTRLDHLEWYVVENGEVIRRQAMGNLDRGPHGDIDVRFPILRIAASSGSRVELYARVQSESSIQLPFVLWETNAYSGRIAGLEFRQSLFFGYLLALAVTGMVFAGYARDRGYFIYSVSIGSQMMSYVILNGYYGWLRLPTSTYWVHNGLLLWQEMSMICGVLFMRHFFNLSVDYPRLDLVVRATAVGFMLFLFAVALGPFMPLAQIIQVQSLLVGLGLLAVSFYFALKRVKIARFYLLAWLLFWLVLPLEILQWQGLIPVRFPPGYAMQWATVFSSTFFLFAMGDKIRQIRLAIVAAQERALALQRQMNVELERQVAERTRELQEAKLAAEEANEAKSRFFSHISHDLRAPLNSLVGLSQSLWLECQDLALPDEFKHFLKQMQQSGSYLSQLMDNILNLAVIDAGKAQVRLEPFLLRDWFEQLQAIVEPIALSKRIRTLWECDAPPGQVLVGDAVKLSQILLNLALNSVKFTPSGKSVHVSLHLAAGLLRIDVEDDGPGVPPEARNRIFECFAQLPHDSFLPPKGVGLGLHIVKQYSDLLGGAVRIEDRAEGGSRFVFTLPVPKEGT